MLIRYRLIRFRLDPDMEEARSVGVIVSALGVAKLEMLGVEEYREDTDPTLFNLLIPEGIEDQGWAYVEWAHRWKSIVSAYDGDDAEFDSQVARIGEISGGQWDADAGGEYELDPEFEPTPWWPDDWMKHGFRGNPLRYAAERLFRELVLSAHTPPLRFLHDIEQTVRTSEMVAYGEVTRDESISVSVDALPAAILHFPILLEGTRRIGFKTVCFRGQRWAEAVAAVNDALYTFDLAVRSGFLTPENCIVLTDRASGASTALAARLDVGFRRVDIDEDRSSSALYQILQEGR